MNIVPKDLQQVDQIAALLQKIDTNDARLFEEVLEKIHRHQPFVLSHRRSLKAMKAGTYIC